MRDKLPYRRYGSAPPDFPPLPGPGRFHRRDAPLPPLPLRTLDQIGRDHVPWYVWLYDKAKHDLHLHDVLLCALAVLLWLCMRYEDARHRMAVLVVRIPRILWFVVLGLGVAGSFAAKNVAAYHEYQLGAARPPAFNAFHPSCPPTFVEATCPAVLGIPGRVYERLLEPSGAINSYYRRSRLCWHPDKAKKHPGYNTGALDMDFFGVVDNLMQYCADKMSQGIGYPRHGYARHLWSVEVQHSADWNASRWDTTRPGPVAFPRRQRECQCTMDDAVSAHLRAYFVPFWTTYPPLPRTLDEYVAFCHCSLAIAWKPYNHIFNTSVVNAVIPWTGDTKMALAWLALRWTSSYPFLPLAVILPQFELRGFREENLPPRGIHGFWVDDEQAGLSDMAGQPKVFTDELKRWGTDGVQNPSDSMSRMQNMPLKEQQACVKQGWCFWTDWGFVDVVRGEIYVKTMYGRRKVT